MLTATNKNAYQLIHRGTLALSAIENNGMRIDVDRLDKTIEQTTNRIKKLTERLKDTDVWKIWKKRYRGKANFGSRTQLGVIFFDEMDFESVGTTKTGRAKTDETALEKIDHVFIKNYLRLEKLKKLNSTYLKGIRRETCDGFLHPSFNLHLVKTHRSSSDSPNFQNIPIRDKKLGKLIRSCFIPRDNHVLVEIDYSSLEFRICASFWRDPVMVEYASDSTKDVHRDMAADCYLLPIDEVPKDARFYAKNQFVFPELYGSNYVNCSRNLWNAINEGDLKCVDGMGLKEHLASGLFNITRLGACDYRKDPIPDTFEYLIKHVEETFMGKFKVFAKRKEEWWEEYQRTGGFDLMTGFRINGVYGRNFLLNAPVQGPAFHILLWSLIGLNNWLVENKMKSKIIGTIHDSIDADVHKDELEEYLAMAKQIMTEDVRKEYEWILTPLEIEAEVSDTNWFNMEEIKL